MDSRSRVPNCDAIHCIGAPFSNSLSAFFHRPLSRPCPLPGVAPRRGVGALRTPPIASASAASALLPCLVSHVLAAVSGAGENCSAAKGLQGMEPNGLAPLHLDKAPQAYWLQQAAPVPILTCARCVCFEAVLSVSSGNGGSRELSHPTGGPTGLHRQGALSHRRKHVLAHIMLSAARFHRPPC